MGEIDLMDKLIPDVKESREEKYIDRNHKIGYSSYNLPMVSTREAIFEGIGYNRLNHNKSILLYTRSIHNQP